MATDTGAVRPATPELLSVPATRAGQAHVAFWLAGRTHPPSTQRLAEFIEHVRATEDEASSDARHLRVLLRNAVVAFHVSNQHRPPPFGTVAEPGHKVDFDRCAVPICEGARRCDFSALDTEARAARIRAEHALAQTPACSDPECMWRPISHLHGADGSIYAYSPVHPDADDAPCGCGAIGVARHTNAQHYGTAREARTEESAT